MPQHRSFTQTADLHLKSRKVLQNDISSEITQTHPIPFSL